MTWWLQRGACTRSHSELGRENPLRRWYCVLRRGRVGRRQAFKERVGLLQTQTNKAAAHFRISFHILPIRFAAGWSSPVARQAHNLKVVGSNPTPATNHFVRPESVTDPGFLLAASY